MDNSSKNALVTAKDEAKPAEKCPICLTTSIQDPSIPGGCGNNPGHVYCFSCLRTWYKNNASCPLCGLQSTFIRHLLTTNGGSGVIEPLEKMKAEFMQEKIKEESERIPLDEEKQLLRKYLHDLNKILNTRDEQHERHRKHGRTQQRTWEATRARLVQCITKVKTLIESCESKSINRDVLNADPVFRGMIYEYQLRREDVSPNEQRRNYNPSIAAEENRINPSRLRAWIRREIPIVMNKTFDDPVQLDEKVETFMLGLLDGHINAPEFEKICRRNFGTRHRPTVTTFCNELFDFASSNYEAEMFFQNSRYRDPTESQGAPQRGLHAEVVDIDDRPFYDRDVEVIGSTGNFRNLREQNQNRRSTRSSTHRNRHPGHTDSDDDLDREIYAYPECRIPRSRQRPNTMEASHDRGIFPIAAFDTYGIQLMPQPLLHQRPASVPKNLADLLQQYRVPPRNRDRESEITLSSDEEGRQRVTNYLAEREGHSSQSSSRTIGDTNVSDRFSSANWIPEHANEEHENTTTHNRGLKRRMEKESHSHLYTDEEFKRRREDFQNQYPGKKLPRSLMTGAELLDIHRNRARSYSRSDSEDSDFEINSPRDSFLPDERLDESTPTLDATVREEEEHFDELLKKAIMIAQKKKLTTSEFEQIRLAMTQLGQLLPESGGHEQSDSQMTNHTTGDAVQKVNDMNLASTSIPTSSVSSEMNMETTIPKVSRKGSELNPITYANQSKAVASANKSERDGEARIFKLSASTMFPQNKMKNCLAKRSPSTSTINESRKSERIRSLTSPKDGNLPPVNAKKARMIPTKGIKQEPVEEKVLVRKHTPIVFDLDRPHQKNIPDAN